MTFSRDAAEASPSSLPRNSGRQFTAFSPVDLGMVYYWIYQKFPGFKPRFPPFQTATLDFARLRECWELPLFTFLFARSHLRIFRADIHLRKTIGDDSTAQELL